MKNRCTAASCYKPEFHLFHRLRSRDVGIGASSAAAAIGVSDYRTRLDAWLEATGRVARSPATSARSGARSSSP
jgi:predicted phage-related endonuclease